MEPTKQDAEAMLKDAGEIETAVRARAPKEHPLYVGMGLTILLIGLAVISTTPAGWPAWWERLSRWSPRRRTVGTNVPYLRRYRQVRMRSTPKWLEWALGLWSAAALFCLGILLDGTIGFSFTLGGIVGAVPFLLWAQRLRRTA